MSEAAVAESEVEDGPTQSELDLQKAKAILEPMIRAGNKSDDEMQIALVTGAGFPFKKAGRLFARALEDLGVRMSRKDRSEQVAEILTKNKFAPKEWTEVQSVCEYLSTELDATDEKQALVAVKRFAKTNGITLPVRPKGVRGSGKGSFRIKSLNWMEENPTATDQEFENWVLKDQQRKVADVRLYGRIHKTVRRVYEAAFANGSQG